MRVPAWYDPNDPLQTPSFAGRAWGVNPKTVHRWMLAGKVAYVEVGPHRRRRIKQSEVERLRVERARVCSTRNASRHSGHTNESGGGEAR